MQLGRPVRIIATVIGIEHDYAAKLCRKLAAEHGIEFKPENNRRREDWEPPVGISEESRPLRRTLGNTLWKLCEELSNPREVARRVGVPVKHQRVATEKPFNYDWSLSQMQRLATASGITIEELMRKALRDG